MKIKASVTLEFEPGEERFPTDDLPIRAEVGTESLSIERVKDGSTIQINAVLLSSGSLGKTCEARLGEFLKETM